MDGSGRRLFDVAINDRTVLEDLDIWKEAGTHAALKKVVSVHVTGGRIVLSFPRVTVGQAVISAIAIASMSASPHPAPSLSLISGLRASPSWSVQDWMDAGDRQYTGSEISFCSLPPALYGAQWLRGPVHPGTGGPVFTVSEEADVYIALDSVHGQKPSWMKDYMDTRSFLRSDQDGGRRFNIYRKRFAKGATVVVGSSPAEHAADQHAAGSYTVAVCPVTGLAPAYDLKFIASYKPDSARLSGTGIIRRTVYGKSAIEFVAGGNREAADENAPAGKAGPSTATWNISVGVADAYSLTVRYADTSGSKKTLLLELIDASGTVLRRKDLVCSVSAAGKWNYATTDTGGMINAGYYTVRLSAAGGELMLSGLDVQ
jgi:beta-galactosidase